MADIPHSWWAPVAVLAVALQGCATPGGGLEARSPELRSDPISRTSPVVARNITNNSKLNSISCGKHEASADGRRAFFGIELEPGTTTVTGYFYCGLASPAKDAGVQIGDRITKVKGCNVRSGEEVVQQFSESAPSTLVFIEVERPGSAGSKPIAVPVLSHIPNGLNRPGRDPASNRCQSTSR